MATHPREGKGRPAGRLAVAHPGARAVALSLGGFFLLWLFPAAAAAAAWQIKGEWTRAEEAGFSSWVAGLGHRQWKSLNEMLRSKENSLGDSADRGLNLFADCADLPYMLRAYYAYKRRLPMVVNSVDGGRYSGPNRTASTIDNLSFEGDAQAFFNRIPQIVHSGNFRTAPGASDSFVYPLAISSAHIRPGVIFYNPNGHLAVVCAVDSDGTVRLLDAHPDQSITRIVLGPKMAWRSISMVGGFKGYRPAVLDRRGRVVFAGDNAQLPGFSTEQYDFGVRYYTEVQQRLARVEIDPLADFEKYIREDTYSEVLDRVASVERGWWIAQRRAIAVPRNIYYADGDWESFATPGRDIRVRLSFLHIPQRAAGYLELLRRHPQKLARRYESESELVADLLSTKQRLFEQLKITYRDSRNEAVILSLAEVERRLFKLSFDPNHAPELRWAASGRELESASRDEPRFHAGFEAQQAWRNRLAPKRGRMHPTDDDNPNKPPPHDLTRLMRELLAGS